MQRLLAASIVAAGLAPCAAGTAQEAGVAGWLAEDEAVRYGRRLVVETYAIVGPEVTDPAMRFAGNNLACADCHLDAATRADGMSLVGVYDRYPAYTARAGRVETLAERINGCMARSMNGRPLAVDAPEMAAIVAYLRFLATDTPASARPAPGDDGMPELDRAADPVRGGRLYAAECAACHGTDGLGRLNGQPGEAEGYLHPPLWGPDSFNAGAGLDRLIDAANFLHDNMPPGATRAAPVLGVADAWDIAAYVAAQPRPAMAGLEKDYPDLLQKPVDAPYGPYADGFGVERHRLGPFAPIRARIAALRTEAGAQP